MMPTVLALLAAAALTGPVPTPTSPDLHLLARQLVDAGAPGVIVRVDDGHGRPIAFADRAAWSDALRPDDTFRMGSNTKTMVATVVLQLVAEHRVRLTDPVEKWLPGQVPDGRAITLRMLLNHTSGLANYLNDPEVLAAFTGQDTAAWTPRRLLAAGVRHDPLFAPGTDYSYSNTNYVALGLVAEKVTGRTLADLIQERIARPLGLTDTRLTTTPPQAHGYEPDAEHLPAGLPAGAAFAGPARAGGYVDTTRNNFTTEWAAGGMVSSARDWARFDRALLSGRLLPPALLAEMRTTRPEEAEFPDRRYGLGLEEVSTPCGTVWGHSGQVPGYSSDAYTDETGTRTATILTTTIFGLATPEAHAADQALIDAAVCAMFDKR